jgi:hypothetical protein
VVLYVGGEPDRLRPYFSDARRSPTSARTCTRSSSPARRCRGPCCGPGCGR